MGKKVKLKDKPAKKVKLTPKQLAKALGATVVGKNPKKHPWTLGPWWR